MKNRKILIPVVLILIAVVGGAFAVAQKLKKSPEATEVTKKNKVLEPLNVIEIAERPYLKINPISDGKNIEVEVGELKKPATMVNYELEYQAGSLLQGIFGFIDLGSLPAADKQLMGSCSAGGACTYHEDVKGGTLLTRFEGPENFALKSDWKYIDNVEKETSFSSKDAKFQLESPELASVRYLVVFNDAGYPGELPGKLVSEIYSLTTSAGTLTGEGELSIRASEGGELKILGWDGTKWQEFDTSISPEDEKVATATVSLSEAFVVIK